MISVPKENISDGNSSRVVCLKFVSCGMAMPNNNQVPSTYTIFFCQILGRIKLISGHGGDQQVSPKNVLQLSHMEK